jgi:uncharacterized OsmC-like protein
MKAASLVAQRQAPLRRLYLEDPEQARSLKWAAAINTADTDALHQVVEIGKGYGVCLRLGIDRSIGGQHDLPNPGDLMCAALAACEAAAVRMVADLLGVQILDLRVEVEGAVDARGCLSIDRGVRVGFQTMTCNVRLQVAPGTAPQLIAALQKAAEGSCVNLDTLRSGVPVDVSFVVDSDRTTSESFATTR